MARVRSKSGRGTDISGRAVLGVVSERYKIIQNREAFAFTDTLLGNGVRYEMAGSLQNGKRVWLLARLTREYIILVIDILTVVIAALNQDNVDKE